jgi:hypothetical protein
VEVSGLFGVLSPVTFTTSTTSNSLTFTQCSSYTANSLPGNIVINALKLPNLAKTTNSLTVQIKDSSGDLVATVASGLTFTAIPGQIAKLELTPANSEVQSTTNV